MDFANGSRLGDPWAMQMYRRAIDRGGRYPHTIRILARAWIRIIWRCWNDEIPFSPELLASSLQSMGNTPQLHSGRQGSP